MRDIRHRAVSLILIAALCSATIVTTGCASSTQITSDPSGAQALVDGQPIGNTPATYSDGSVWVWTKHQVSLKKTGYYPYVGRMTATVNVPMLILGIAGFFLCCAVGGVFALIGEFKPTYHYLLQKQAAAEPEEWVEAAPIVFHE